MPYLAFDLGASSGRAVVGRLRAGRMEMEEVHRFETGLTRKGGRLCWNVEALWDELQTGLRKALRVAPALQSLSVDSWACDYVPLDAGGRLLRDPYSYRDERTDGWVERAFETAPADELFAATGIQFLPFNTLFQLLADRDGEPGVFEATRRRLTIAEYFLWRFGGRPVVERSMASTTQLADPREVQWNEALMQRFGLDGNAWPEIVPPGTTLGTVQSGTAPEDENQRPKTEDRRPKIDIVAGLSHDTACAVAAVPAENDSENWAYVSSGTWSLLGAELDAPILTAEARETGFTNEAGLGGTTRFLKNLTGLWPLQECVREWREKSETINYDQLFAEAEAAGPAAAEIDLEDECFLPRGRMQERLEAYCRETGQPAPETRGALTRALLEGIAASYGHALADLERLTGRRTEVLHIVGGGAKVDLLCRLAAEATRCRIVAGPAEATALGNLLVQADAAGDLPHENGQSVSARVRAAARRSVETTAYEPAFSPS